MKLWRIAFMMLAAFSLASCKPSARQTAADAEQPTNSTEAVTSADTLVWSSPTNTSRKPTPLYGGH